MTLYRCPKCKQSVLVTIPAQVVCVPCEKSVDTAVSTLLSGVNPLTPAFTALCLLPSPPSCCSCLGIAPASEKPLVSEQVAA